MRAFWAIPLVLTGAAEAQRLDLSLVEGVYRHRISREAPENVLEIVGVSSQIAYLRLRLHFDNGHVCNMWGRASVEQGALVYRRPQSIPSSNPGQNACVLRLRFTAGRVIFEDEGGLCRAEDCGVHGSYDSAGFAQQSRRRITDLDHLLGSREYREAGAEFEARALPPR